MNTIFLTNIAAPYRIDLFNDLDRYSKAAGAGFDFEVYFMRLTEANRSWRVNTDNIKFKHTLGKGLYLYIRNFHFHLNPVLLFRLIKSDCDIVLGGSWNNPNVLIISALKRAGILKNKIHIWSEANHLTIGSSKNSKLKHILRKFVFGSIDGTFIVPGKMSILTFKHWGITPPQTILLPNLVSTEKFHSENKTNKETTNIPVFLIVARLEEKYKGILNFMEAIGPDNVKKIKLRIVGSGKSINTYMKFVAEHGLESNVEFAGEVAIEHIASEYSKADIFVLPSYSDPSPLAVVEACKAGIPLFISNRCGNHFEAVSPGKNGYTFDPYKKTDIREKFELLLLEKEKWGDYSKASIAIAEESFNNEKVLTTFIKEMREGSGIQTHFTQ